MQIISPEVLIEDLDNNTFLFYDIFDNTHDMEFDKIDIMKNALEEYIRKSNI